MTDYSTLAEIRAHLRIGSGEWSDTTVTDSIAEATAKIDRDTGRTWQSEQTVTDEEYSGDGTNRLILNHSDITSLDALSINVSPTGSTYTTITTSKVRYKAGIGVLELQPDAEVPYFPDYFTSVKASYKYGDTTAPNDIKMACRYLVAFKLKKDKVLNDEYTEIVNSYRIDRYRIA